MKKLRARKAKKPTRKPTNGKRPRGKAMRAAIRWDPDLNAYVDLKALTFPNAEEIDAAIDLLWSDSLRKLPHELAGGNTIIVPAAAVRYFAAAALTFSEDEVLSPSDLPAEEINALRRDQGPY